MYGQAIETEFAGYKFRSRIEARWAVFFDTLGLNWGYEVEGFHVGTEKYLPDFLLPDLNMWVEIKGAPPTSKEISLAKKLAAMTERGVAILHGPIPDMTGREFANDKGKCYGWIYISPDGLIYEEHLWAQCTFCGCIGFEASGHAQRICDCMQHKYNGDSELIKAAYTKAKQARFEHGATPEANFHDLPDLTHLNFADFVQVVTHYFDNMLNEPRERRTRILCRDLQKTFSGEIELMRAVDFMDSIDDSDYE